MNPESEELAKKLGAPWTGFASNDKDAVAIMANIDNGYQVLVVVGPHEVSCCVRQDVPMEFKSGKINVREYLTPFTPILYRPTELEDADVAVTKALKVQLGYAERACNALRKIVEGGGK